jgi:hypothetical protein
MSFPRYPKYKPSGVEWLGEVPEHWEIVTEANLPASMVATNRTESGFDHQLRTKGRRIPYLGGNGCLTGFAKRRFVSSAGRESRNSFWPIHLETASELQCPQSAISSR